MRKRWNEDSYAHKMVAHLQEEMAQEIYEEKARSDEFYRSWDRAAFVKMVAPTLRDHARSVLSEMLERHDVPERDKDEIYEALLLDLTIPNEDRWYVQ